MEAPAPVLTGITNGMESGGKWAP